MDKTQVGVARGVAAAALISVCGLAIAALLTPNYLEHSVTLYSRLHIAVLAMLAPLFSLVVCIGRLANHRFRTPEDINGPGLTNGTDKSKLLQALLQNTLEQATIAISVYFCGAIVLPVYFLGAILAAGAMFFVGRIAFITGYKNGAAARALGFGLTFYPTVLLIVVTTYFALVRAIATAG